MTITLPRPELTEAQRHQLSQATAGYRPVPYIVSRPAWTPGCDRTLLTKLHIVAVITANDLWTAYHEYGEQRRAAGELCCGLHQHDLKDGFFSVYQAGSSYDQYTIRRAYSQHEEVACYANYAEFAEEIHAQMRAAFPEWAF